MYRKIEPTGKWWCVPSCKIGVGCEVFYSMVNNSGYMAASGRLRNWKG